VDDPQGRLGAPPIEVSIFDHSMGYGREFAMRNRGVTAPGAPYRETYSSADVGTFGSGPPASLRLAFVIPTLSEEGYWLAALEPRQGKEKVSQAAFVRFNEYFPAPEAPLVPVRYNAEGTRDGWVIRMVIAVGAGQPQVSQ
jgi:hypothetical protein